MAPRPRARAAALLLLLLAAAAAPAARASVGEPKPAETLDALMAEPADPEDALIEDEAPGEAAAAAAAAAAEPAPFKAAKVGARQRRGAVLGWDAAAWRELARSMAQRLPRLPPPQYPFVPPTPEHPSVRKAHSKLAWRKAGKAATKNKYQRAECEVGPWGGAGSGSKRSVPFWAWARRVAAGRRAWAPRRGLPPPTPCACPRPRAPVLPPPPQMLVEFEPSASGASGASLAAPAGAGPAAARAAAASGASSLIAAAAAKHFRGARSTARAVMAGLDIEVLRAPAAAAAALTAAGAGPEGGGAEDLGAVGDGTLVLARVKDCNAKKVRARGPAVPRAAPAGRGTSWSVRGPHKGPRPRPARPPPPPPPAAPRPRPPPPPPPPPRTRRCPRSRAR
jgi:hypothetical protein